MRKRLLMQKTVKYVPKTNTNVMYVIKFSVQSKIDDLGHNRKMYLSVTE